VTRLPRLHAGVRLLLVEERLQLLLDTRTGTSVVAL
jgi:hypothetical protein